MRILHKFATTILHTDFATASSKAEFWMRIGIEKEQTEFRSEGDHDPTRTDPARAPLQRGLDFVRDVALRCSYLYRLQFRISPYHLMPIAQ